MGKFNLTGSCRWTETVPPEATLIGRDWSLITGGWRGYKTGVGGGM